MFSGFCSVLIALVAAAAGEATWVSTEGQITFDVAHPFHDVSGKSDQGEAVILLGDGVAKVVARVKVTSFDSGNGNRDAHMLEIIEAAQYPLAVVRFVMDAPSLPAPETKKSLRVNGQVDFHGVKTSVPIAIEVTAPSSQTVVATFSFAAKLDAHKVKRPSLMFVKIEDTFRLSGTFKLRPKP